MGGARFTTGPMGAHQLEKPKNREIFFNWNIFVMNLCQIVSSTAIVYVQNDVSWAWGFGLSAAVNAVGLLLFFIGTRFYRQLKPQGNPFSGLAHVFVTAFRNRRIKLSENPGDYHQEDASTNPILPTKSFRFLNHAAVKVDGDANQMNGSARKSNQTCSVARVEEFKRLIRMIPLWTSSLFLCVPLAIQTSLGVLQALTMDRNLGPNFKIPAATVAITDRILLPMWSKFGLKPITPLQRIGIGHSIDILSMASVALVEARRLKISQLHDLQNQENGVVPMSMLWLVIPLGLAGIGEAFHFPGHISFYHQEFPSYLKNTSAAVVSLSFGIAYYLNSGLIHVVRESTDWLPDDMNKGRLDNVYCLVTILVAINFCYFLLCASLYRV